MSIIDFCIVSWNKNQISTIIRIVFLIISIFYTKFWSITRNISGIPFIYKIVRKMEHKRRLYNDLDPKLLNTNVCQGATKCKISKSSVDLFFLYTWHNFFYAHAEIYCKGILFETIHKYWTNGFCTRTHRKIRRHYYY